MELQSAYASGLQGLQRASTGITEATVNINRETTNEQRLRNAQDTAAADQAAQQRQVSVTERANPSLEQSLVQLVTEQNFAEANIKSIKTADEVLGSVIDIRV
ncbi:MAG: excinuclease ATPase subunit [Rheinheimera sp.]